MCKSISKFDGEDYMGASFQDIYGDLEVHRNDTHTLIQALNTYRNEVIQNKDKIDHHEDAIRYVDRFIDAYSRFLSEFDMLLSGISKCLNEKHIYLLEKLFDSSEDSARLRLIESCKNFKSDYINVTLRDESIRPLFDKIYAESREVVSNYGGFSGAIPRLKTYIGEKLKSNESGLVSEAESAEEVDNPGYERLNKPYSELLKVIKKITKEIKAVDAKYNRNSLPPDLNSKLKYKFNNVIDILYKDRPDEMKNIKNNEDKSLKVYERISDLRYIETKEPNFITRTLFADKLDKTESVIQKWLTENEKTSKSVGKTSEAKNKPLQ
jgi:hypothetical protein